MPAGIVRRVALSAAPAEPLSSAGEMRLVTAHLIDVFGNEIPSPEVSWRTSDSTVATVFGVGNRAVVTAVGDGRATVTATSEGVDGTLPVTVTVGAAGYRRASSITADTSSDASRSVTSASRGAPASMRRRATAT
jgi:uncharacterized protein YjdB